MSASPSTRASACSQDHRGYAVNGSVEKTDATVYYEVAGSRVMVAGHTFMLGFQLVPQGTLVCVSFGLGGKVKLNPGFESLWSGLREADVLASHGTDALLQMSEGNTTDIFYPDGSVAAVTLQADGLVKKYYTAGQALDKRLKVVEGFFSRAATITDGNKRAPRQDRSFHELAAMLRFTSLYPDFRKKITSIIGTQTKHAVGGQLRDGVRKHFFAALRSIGDTSAYWWLGSSPEVASVLKPAKPPAGKPSPLKSTTKPVNKLELAERRAKRVAESPTGRHESAPDPHGKGKKQNKKK